MSNENKIVEQAARIDSLQNNQRKLTKSVGNLACDVADLQNKLAMAQANNRDLLDRVGKLEGREVPFGNNLYRPHIPQTPVNPPSYRGVGSEEPPYRGVGSNEPPWRPPGHDVYCQAGEQVRTNGTGRPELNRFPPEVSAYIADLQVYVRAPHKTADADKQAANSLEALCSLLGSR